MKLVTIPKEKYDDYRLDVIFDSYKWDPQFLDNNTIARHVLVLTPKEAEEIYALTEKLDSETVLAENFLNNNQHLIKPLNLPKQIKGLFKRMSDYDHKGHVRLMRFDFHPTVDGTYAVSEVNSDVPGGFAESSVMPAIAAGYLGGKYSFRSFGDRLVSEIVKKLQPGAAVAMVHCTSYSDDRQVMQFLGDRLESIGYKPVYMAADHLKFEQKKAISLLNGREGEVGFIFRFTPLEWLIGIKPKRWTGYFDTVTPSCNHPVSMFAQTKRFPMVFDVLEQNGIDLTAWRSLLPKTIEVKDSVDQEGFIFKPACGRVGEGISIRESCTESEYNKILRAVKKYPMQYIAQKRFASKPLPAADGREYHVCLGAYSVEGKASGFYARISLTPRIDSNAADIPVLIEEESDGR